MSGAHCGLVDHTELTDTESLADSECLRVLRTRAIGRIGVTVDGVPWILPVSYSVHGNGVVFRTTVGTRFDDLVLDADVVFETDSADPAFQSGWAVLGWGRVSEITDPVELAELGQLPLRPWVRRDHYRWVHLEFTALTGWRIVQLRAWA